MMRNAFLTFISFSIIFTPTVQILASRSAGNSTGELYERYLDRTDAFMEDIRTNLNRPAFDLEALLEVLDYDADTILAFVRNSIAFEQYRGVLRGPLGTLFSRAGNSIDQALLAAKLLRDAGYDARLAHAMLTEEQAVAVLQTMRHPVEPAPPFGDADAIWSTLKRYGLVDAHAGAGRKARYLAFVGSTPSAKATNAYDAVVGDSEYIVDLLTAAGIHLEAAPVAGALVEEARDYYWVQYREETSNPWADVHPIFVGEPPFTIAAQGYLTETVPEHLQYRFRFEAFIERSVAGRLETAAIMTPWERPVANLAGVTLTFSNIGDSMLATDALQTDLKTHAQETRTFVPAFGSGMAPGASFFDLRGTLIDPMAAQDSKAGLFATLGDAFATATGSISDESQLPILTAQWLEFTIIAPGGEETVYRRTTLDRIGPAARATGIAPDGLTPTTHDAAWPLFRRHTVMVSTGGLPRGYAAEAAFQRFQQSRDAVIAAMEMRKGDLFDPAALKDVPVHWPGHLTLPLIFDAAATLGSHHRIYRSGPGLVIHSGGLGVGGGQMEAIDIVTNPRRAIDVSKVVPAPDPDYVLRAGVWDTHVEGSLLRPGERLDTRGVFDAAQKADIPSATLLPGSPVRAIDYPQDVLAAVSADLSRGYAVIIPEREVAPGQVAWWRVDPQTGETLGQIADGRGGEILETIITATITIGAFIYGWYSCDEITGNAPYACCMFANAGMAAFTVAIGLGEGLALAIMSGALDLAATQIPTGEWCEVAFSDAGPQNLGNVNNYVAATGISCMSPWRHEASSVPTATKSL